jgi:photosystem II stability/assembly factor-like uncharacterized protein
MAKFLRSSSFLLILVCLNLKGFTQSACDTITWIAPLPQGNNLNAVTSTDANTFYAAGNYGTILKSTDTGQTWALLNSSSTNNLNAIFFTSANIGYAAGQGGVIFKTTNGGASWQSLVVPTKSTLLALYFTDANTGYAAGGALGGLILKTTDAGASWDSLPSPATSTLIAISFFRLHRLFHRRKQRAFKDNERRNILAAHTPRRKS